MSHSDEREVFCPLSLVRLTVEKHHPISKLSCLEHLKRKTKQTKTKQYLKKRYGDWLTYQKDLEMMNTLIKKT